MTEENKEVIEEVTEKQNEQPIEEAIENVINETKFDSAGDDSVIKVDLDSPPPKSEVVEEKENVVKEPEVEEPKAEETKTEQVEEQPVIEEVTEEQVEETQEVAEEPVIEQTVEKEPLPENLQKVVQFMEETGGDLNDYVQLNRDMSKMDDSDVLDEYYRSTKSHLSAEERNFLLEDNFGINEDIDDERTIRKKKIALKEQVAEARAHLDGQKSKYYEDIKAGSKLTPEQQEAIDFYRKHNEESERNQKLSEASKNTFQQKTNNLFNDKFKGFEYNVGDKRYRFNVKDIEKIKTTQSDINNFVNQYVGEDRSTIEDARGYHKSLFTAMNADTIAKHFYEQGRADAIKGQVASDKNINLEPRQTHGEVNVDGVRVRALGESSSEIKNRDFKIRKKN